MVCRQHIFAISPKDNTKDLRRAPDIATRHAWGNLRSGKTSNQFGKLLDCFNGPGMMEVEKALSAHVGLWNSLVSYWQVKPSCLLLLMVITTLVAAFSPQGRAVFHKKDCCNLAYTHFWGQENFIVNMGDFVVSIVSADYLAPLDIRAITMTS